MKLNSIFNKFLVYPSSKLVEVDFDHSGSEFESESDYYDTSSNVAAGSAEDNELLQNDGNTRLSEVHSITTLLALANNDFRNGHPVRDEGAREKEPVLPCGKKIQLLPGISDANTLHQLSQTDLFNVDEARESFEKVKSEKNLLIAALEDQQAEDVVNDSLLRVQFEEAQSIAIELEKRLNEKEKTLRKIEDAKKETEKELCDKDAARIEAESQLDILKSKVSIFREKVKNELCTKKERDEVRAKLEVFEHENSVLLTNVQQLMKNGELDAKEIIRLESLTKEQQKNAKSLEKERNEYKENYLTLQKDKSQQKLIQKLQDEIKNKQLQVLEFQTKVKAAIEQVEVKNKALQAVEQTVGTLKLQISKTKTDSDAEITKWHSKNTQLQEENEKLTDEKNKQVLALQEKDSALRKIEIKLNQMNTFVKNLQDENEKLQMTKAKLAELSDERSAAFRKLEATKIEKDQLLEKFQEKDSTLRKIEIQLNQSNMSIKKLQDENEKLQMANVKLTELGDARSGALRKLEAITAEKDELLEKLSKELTGSEVRHQRLKELSSAALEEHYRGHIETAETSATKIATIHSRLSKLGGTEFKCVMSIAKLKENVEKMKLRHSQIQGALEESRRALIIKSEETQKLNIKLVKLQKTNSEMKINLQNVKTATEIKLQEFQALALNGITDIGAKLSEKEKLLKRETEKLDKIREDARLVLNEKKILGNQLGLASTKISDYDGLTQQLLSKIQSLELKNRKMINAVLLYQELKGKAECNRQKSDEHEMVVMDYKEKCNLMANEIRKQNDLLVSHFNFLNRALSIFSPVVPPSNNTGEWNLGFEIESYQNSLLLKINQIFNQSKVNHLPETQCCSEIDCRKILAKAFGELAILKRKSVIGQDNSTNQDKLNTNDNREDNTDKKLWGILKNGLRIQKGLSFRDSLLQRLGPSKEDEPQSLENAFHSLFAIKNEIETDSKRKISEWGANLDVIAQKAGEQAAKISTLENSLRIANQSELQFKEIQSFLSFLEHLFLKEGAHEGMIDFPNRINKLYQEIIAFYDNSKKCEQSVNARDMFVVEKLGQIKRIAKTASKHF